MKKIWIINHYAFRMYFGKGGRHYWIAKHLQKKGYDVEIFCSNVEHNGNRKIETDSYATKTVDNIKFNFIKTSEYQNNGLSRIKNMYSFYKNILRYKKHFDKPDIILASSVHLLSILAGYKLSRYFKVPLISEIRDLWPESLIAYGSLKKQSIIAKLLYRLEKYLYIRSDRIIMTWEGGKDYIKDKGWSNKVDLNKIYFITNGIDLDSFKKNSQSEFEDNKIVFKESDFNILYTGSIREVNNIQFIVEVAKELKGYQDIIFHIVGDGTERQAVQNDIDKLGLRNVILWGPIPKEQIPSVITESDLNLLHNRSTSLDRYGQSQNKLFEYLAAGRPILQTYTNKYSIIKKHNAGMVTETQNVNEVMNNILEIYKNKDLQLKYSKNALKGAVNYDYKVHTENVEKIIQNLL